MLFFSLMFLKETMLAPPFWVQLACAFPLGLSGTTLHFLFIIILRPVPLQDVFLLPIPSVGTSTSLTKTEFCLRILVSGLLSFVQIYFYVFFL
jgi:hypothetical protein